MWRHCLVIIVVNHIGHKVEPRAVYDSNVIDGTVKAIHKWLIK